MALTRSHYVNDEILQVSAPSLLGLGNESDPLEGSWASVFEEFRSLPVD